MVFVTSYLLHVSAFVTPPSGRISHYLLEHSMLFYNVTLVVYLVCNTLYAFSWNMEEVIDYKNVRNRELQNNVTLLVCMF